MSLTLTSQGAHYRTKLMDRQQAEQFAKCLAANGRFQAVNVSDRPRSEGRFFVSFQPASEERRVDMLQREADARTVRGLTEGSNYLFILDKDGGRPFFWCLSTSGEVYETTVHDCTCPDRHYRGRANGIPCKHMVSLKAGAGEVRSW